jgi:pimeloyl-ACP methyl ester carboxylesterase
MADLTPERIAGVILLNAATMGRETLIPFRLMTLPVLGEVMTKPSKAGVERQIKAIFMHASVATNEVRQVIERNTFKTGGNKAFLATLRAMTTFSGQNSAVVERTLNILRSIKCPLLFIHGRHDTVIPVKHSIDAQSIVTNSKLLILEDCGHTPQMEKPVEINSALRNFLLSLEK